MQADIIAGKRHVPKPVEKASKTETKPKPQVTK
jgi:hypothetical protein